MKDDIRPTCYSSHVINAVSSFRYGDRFNADDILARMPKAEELNRNLVHNTLSRLRKQGIVLADNFKYGSYRMNTKGKIYIQGNSFSKSEFTEIKSTLS